MSVWFHIARQAVNLSSMSRRRRSQLVTLVRKKSTLSSDFQVIQKKKKTNGFETSSAKMKSRHKIQRFVPGPSQITTSTILQLIVKEENGSKSGSRKMLNNPPIQCIGGNQRKESGPGLHSVAIGEVRCSFPWFVSLSYG